jgi:hypothetical protein
MYNSKLFKVRFEDPQEIVQLQERLGFATFFPFFQPENSSFDFDLHFYDHRLSASIYMQLCVAEKFQNLHSFEFIRTDGTKDEDIFEAGVPPSWRELHRIPKQGHFRACYRCAPEDRKFGQRKNLAKTYGYYDIDVEAEDVHWTTGLGEVPADVLEFMEFLMVKGFSHCDEFYDKIDAPFGMINFKQFLEALHKLGCKKFAHQDPQVESDRVMSVFRFLDPGGEGTVTRAEFSVLDQLWKEFILSTKEFVHFLVLTFGNNLRDAWEVFDDDFSGEITCLEWVHAVKEIGYFGPSEVVFSLLDTTDDGSIEWKEFQVLETYKREPAAPVE